MMCRSRRGCRLVLSEVGWTHLPVALMGSKVAWELLLGVLGLLRRYAVETHDGMGSAYERFIGVRGCGLLGFGDVES
jgi:hypothetical protein